MVLFGPAKLWLLIWTFTLLNPIDVTQSQTTTFMKTPNYHVGNTTHGGPFNPVKPKQVSITQFTRHNDQVCSTWGNCHFKTFNGDIYYYPGTCTYVFASHCKGNQQDFKIVFKREEENGLLRIKHIMITIHDMIIEINNNSITMDGELVTETPVDKFRILIDRMDNNTKITYLNEFYFLWNGEDSMLLKLSREKYGNQTCGMCGDFNGVTGLRYDGIPVTAEEFGNMQKQNGPTEDCSDVPASTSTECTDVHKKCESVLMSEAFSNCNKLLNPMEYVEICVQDLCKCSSKNQMSCLCNMFAEYSRQCAHAGGVPGNWRTPELCPKTCPLNMIHQEYSSPCLNTCSNTERSVVCEDHNLEGCFCPSGTVLDDINNTGCIPHDNCFCVYDGNKYSPGSMYSTTCRACTCNKGKWKCNELPCTGSCSVEGGSHITTFDGLRYHFNGECSYVLAKHTTGHDFVLIADLHRCAMSSSKSCLKGIALVMNAGENVLTVKENCATFLNWMAIQAPVSVGNLTITQPTSFFLNIQTKFGMSVMIQCVPIMQIFIDMESSYQHQMCGMCGNFNNRQDDDFKTLSGVNEGTAAGFANTWKTLANCPNIKNSYENPCSSNVEKEKYAMHWCSLLTSLTGPFSECHNLINPLTYHSNCMTDTCSGPDSEGCMCAALSSYAYACNRKGLLLTGWRDDVCQKYMQNCKENQVYRYNVTQLQPTCQSLSEPVDSRHLNGIAVDGCVCKDGTYMNDNGDCVEASACPCYYLGNVLKSGEIIEENGVACSCDKGQLHCMGKAITTPGCTHPLIYLNCTNAPKGTKGVECQKSCDTLDMDCYSCQCISGCVCPKNLVSDGKGGCIPEQQCPCIHNEAAYKPGTTISVACNTCTCKNRKWQCTLKQCLGRCSVYGDGHHISFDNKEFTFSGACEYTLVQDNCGEDEGQSSFKVLMQNVQCGYNGTICSKTIKIFWGKEEIRLDNAEIELVKRAEENHGQYEMFRRGIFLILNFLNKFFLMWDTKGTIQIKLSPELKKKVCGICGNYDGNANNDFTTRSHSVVENLMEFYNSWKTDPKCPDVHEIENPCSVNPYRKAWSTKQCAIITSNVFQACHSQVDPKMYYDSCIRDSCSCNSGGDCECFCTAVAAYSQACSENGVCIRWRTPTICPMFCDYYNDAGECAWHYKPCGNKCLKTCKNPKGECLYELSGLEGCYPSCPASKPFLNEDSMKCVSQCGCDDEHGNFYNYGEKVPSKENCYSCECSRKGISCKYDKTACRCQHNGKMYKYLEKIPNGNNEDAKCKEMTCDVNGTVATVIKVCTTTVTTTITPQPSIITTTTITTSTPTYCSPQCRWTQWFDESNPSEDEKGDIETYDTITSKGKEICKDKIYAHNIECTLADSSNDRISSMKEINYTCDIIYGLVCMNSNQDGPRKTCPNFKTRYMCCDDFSYCNAEIPTTTKFTSTAKITSTASTSTSSVFSTPIVSSTSKPNTPSSPLTTARNPETTSRVSENTIPTSTFLFSTTKISSTVSTGTSPFISTPTKSTPIIKPDTKFTTTAKPHTSTTKTTSTTATGTSPVVSSTFSVSSSESNTPFKSLTTATKPETSPESTSRGSETPPSTITIPTSAFPSSTTKITPTKSPCNICHWTQWFNENHPTSEPHSGDKESLEILKSKGYSVCSNQSYVQDVKCEASSYSGVPHEQLGQNMTCNVTSGLICRNIKNQGMPWKMCLDYKMQFLCCSTKKCPTTTPISSTSTSLVTTAPSTSTITTTKQMTTTTPETKPPGFCVYEGSTYEVGSPVPQAPGSCQTCRCTVNMYNKVAITCEPIMCNKHCQKGFFYQEVNGQCCGTCVQEYCVINDTFRVEVGSPVPQPPGSCETCRCTANMNNMAEITCEPITCNARCQVGFSYEEVEGQCCGTCVQESCVVNGTMTIKVGSPVPQPPGSCQTCKCTATMNNTLEIACKPITCNKHCPMGYSYIEVPGHCCGTCVQEFCVVNDTVKIKVGSQVPQPPGSCQKCKCTATMNGTLEIACKPITCNTDCPMGYSLKKIDGQCCGKCVQECCVLNNTIKIKPGEIWHPPGENCTSYECESNTYMVVKNIVSCPQQKPINCDKGILVNFTSKDGCCTVQFCEPRKCDVMKSQELIETGGCKANVTITNCGGYCSSVSRQPNFPKMEKHNCTCCQPTKVEHKEVKLACDNGRNIVYTFDEVLKCSCRDAACVFTQ